MAHHFRALETFAYTVETEEHRTGIAIVAYPLKVEPLQSFTVEVAVICMDKGCDLTGKRFFVSENGIDEDFKGTLTWKAWNARYMKWEYHGKVTCRAPEQTGSYEWFAVFPYQSRHRRSMARFP